MTGPPVHLAFAAQAARTPRRCAVVVGPVSVTYGQLAAMVTAVRDALLDRPDGPVAGYFDHSVEAVAAFLGVLAAGRWYVPLAPVQGRDRVASALTDCGARTILTTAAHRADLDPPSGVRCLDLPVAPDRPHATADRPHATPDRPHATPDRPHASDRSPAYAIYTSGSTGRPKGVLVAHRALAVSTAARRQLYGDGGTLFLAAPLCFDSSVSLFAPLVSGGTVVLSSAPAQDAVGLAGEVERHRATHTLLLPTVYSELLTVWGSRQPPALTVAIVAGEVLTPSVVRRHLALAPGRRLVNEYGPTEATVFCTAHDCGPRDATAASVPIGRAVPGYRVAVLDAEARPVPDGERGELCVAGPGLADGYLGQPGSTARRFTPAPDGRWYHTGDLGSCSPDGLLSYHGRIDDQVKIRGVRVELSEVDTRLAAVPGVLAAASAVVDGRLVGFVRLAPGARVDPAALAALGHLAPQAVHTMPALPMTPTGKTDRNALVAWHAARHPSTQDSVQHHERTARGLAATLATGALTALVAAATDVLGFAPPVDAPFVGYADSLAALRIGVRLHLDGWRLDPVDLLDGASLQAVAARVRPPDRPDPTHPDTTQTTDTDRAEPTPTAGPDPADPDTTPLTPSQLGIWYAERSGPPTTAFTIPLRIRLLRTPDADRLDAALSTVVARHPVLARRVHLRDRHPVMVRTGRPRLDVLDLTAPAPAPVPAPAPEPGSAPASDPPDDQSVADELAALEAGTAIDVTSEAPLRALLVRRTGGRAELLLTLHHLAVDGWSLAVLLRELGAAYDGRDPGPAPPGFLAHAAAAHRSDAGGAFAVAARAAARDLLGVPTVLDLRANGGPAGRRPGTHRLEVTPRLRAGLAARAVAGHTTLFTVLLAGFALALAEVSGQPAFVVGTVHANRPTPDDERAVGQFATVVPIALDLSTGADPVRHVAARVRTGLRHARVPLHRVVEAAAPVRRPHTDPLVQVLFEYFAGPRPEFTVDGVTTRLSTADLGHGAVTDVSLRVLDHDGGLRCFLVHDASVVDEALAERLGRATSAAWRRLAGPGGE